MPAQVSEGAYIVRTRYEVNLSAPGKNITTTIFAVSIRELAETIIKYHPGTSLVSAREVTTTKENA
jgi:hypothetical protein